MNIQSGGRKTDLQYPNPETASLVRWNKDAGDVKPPRPTPLARALAPVQALLLTSVLVSLIMGAGVTALGVAILWLAWFALGGVPVPDLASDVDVFGILFWGIIGGVTLWGLKFWLSAILEERSSRLRMQERAARPSLKEQLIRPPEE